jgi:hypothetical protein
MSFNIIILKTIFIVESDLDVDGKLVTVYEIRVTNYDIHNPEHKYLFNWLCDADITRGYYLFTPYLHNKMFDGCLSIDGFRSAVHDWENDYIQPTYKIPIMPGVHYGTLPIETYESICNQMGDSCARDVKRRTIIYDGIQEEGPTCLGEVLENIGCNRRSMVVITI